MANVRRSDCENIVQVFNELGNKAALEYLQQNFGVKYPRDVITRIKKTPGILLLRKLILIYITQKNQFSWGLKNYASL
jgi:hypothetical protein